MNESLREIVFDTETTGFNYSGDDRIVEIGCVEMLNHTPTGKTFHCYINPEREVPEEVVRVHGLTTEFLSDKPKFAEIAKDFVDFIGDANMVAHNAVFDMNFINAEFRRLGMQEVSFDRMVDTLAISRKKNPHLAKHNLDSLCNRYGIDNSHRELHGALLDARLLAEVYIELLGGKEVDFFKTSDEEMEITASSQNKIKKKPFRPSRNFSIPEADLKNHNDFIASLGDNVIWNKKESAI
ncbi:DNA polymerase III subunit epsilon [bacterium]|nr:DNA polymerase III subunit epsilon [bacterium]